MGWESRTVVLPLLTIEQISFRNSEFIFKRQAEFLVQLELQSNTTC